MQEVLEVVSLWMKVVIVVIFLLEVPAVELVVMLLDVAHLFNCIIDLLLKLKETKLLLPMLLHLLTGGIEVIDLTMKFLIPWFQTNDLPLLDPCLLKEILVSLVGVHEPEYIADYRRLLWWHNVG
jgi:hypothetical protein